MQYKNNVISFISSKFYLFILFTRDKSNVLFFNDVEHVCFLSTIFFLYWTTSSHIFVKKISNVKKYFQKMCL